ncbi:glycosyltransferase family 39 protein [Sistotremastrum suecicum HHB10207 ss-3]|uniref:Dolichyl-phosphate-mannose--protein mannosyltransferase n=1 Tax=Sistotremastrum suecicum HHB10207 ss-3 TaxID=1314776 RepID=A0A166IRP0_9AGAM|nr:glycosyltransferase family 39 protein [Sistotremastrum suecicum HHB10207 ss-3]
MPSNPGEVALEIDSPTESPRASSEFEEVSYPTWSQPRAEEELPLHYMGEDKARRRVKGAQAAPESTVMFDADSPAEYDQGDDGGKDVYAKLRQHQTPVSRMRRTSAPPTSVSEFIQQNLEHLPPAIYTLLSCWTRFHDIGKSPYVVWDEAHFGKFGSHYLKREFYFDVHPPLGKMLVGLAGLLSGYNGNYEFKSGEQYPDDVPFVAMRVMLATFGVAMVPLGWYTAVELGMSRRACHLVALMVLCDVAWLAISRFILLDSMLLFFTFLTVYCLTKFNNQQHEPFSFDWWTWLSFTGLSIGMVCSVKWIGLFVTALVGVYTIEDLWEKFGDLKMPVRTYIRHWVARAGCLIGLPIIVYLISFKLHFLILNHSGPGDAQMSSLFQAHLVGNDFSRSPLEAAYGSRVTLKNMGWGGGLLHSHVQTYPVGSSQQQVTCYHYKDENNDWVFLPRWEEPEYNPNGELQFVKHGDVLRLSHFSTGRNMHSHAIPAPVTKTAYEVSGYGNQTIGDSHDYWMVEVVDDIRRGHRNNFETIHTLTTRLRFKHWKLGCYLRAANAVLPQWGFKQIEVSCEKEDNPRDEHTYWNIESHINDRLPPAEITHIRSPFFRDFWHLNVAMMTSNNALIPDPDKEDILASKPFDWPWLHLGLRMCGWGDNQTKYYLLGTPVIWWSGTASLGISLVVFVVYLLRMQRKYVDFAPGEWDHFLYVGKIALFGWCFHYLPFLIMGRVTYVHHYLPALYFSVLMVAHLIDHFFLSARSLSERTKWAVFAFCVISIVGTFWWFRGVAFGIDGPINDHKGLGWRKSWNIYSL